MVNKSAQPKNQNIPKLRFGGFAGEWKKEKLGNVADFYKGKGISKDDIVVGGQNKCIRYGELYTMYGEIISEVKSRTNALKTEGFLSKKNDIIIPSSGETALDIASVSCVKEKDILLGGDLNVIRLQDNQIGDFFAYYLTHFQNKNIAKLAQGNSVVHLYASHLKMLKVALPTFPEQQKIAEFLGGVDEWVENLREQKESLESYKKGMMQKIFSQEIRFRDDKGKEFPEWEEKKLGEIGNIRTSSVDKISNPNEKKVRLLNYMDVYKRDHIFANDVFQEVTAKDNQILSCDLKKGDVMFTPSSETPIDIGHSAVVMEDLPNTVFSYHIIRLRPLKNILVPKFSAYTFKSFFFYKKLWRRAQGATRFTISLEAFNEVSVFIPQSMTEQQKIADFLGSIDKVLESKQQQITQAEQWKKGLMQGLFV